VWKGLLLGGTSTDPAGKSEFKSLVAVKHAWYRTHRVSEAAMYLLAASGSVRSLSPVLFHAEYDDISQDVCLSPTTPLRPNRQYTQLVLSTFGKIISDPTLTPLQVGRALLTAVMIHGDLFFTGRILHQCLSINNIIALQEPTEVKSSM